MEMRRGAIAVVLAVAALVSTIVSTAAGEPVVIKLGFLTPYPAQDSAVPLRLADEWISAMRVALEVLGEQHQQDFQVEPYVQNSDCTRQSAADSAARLVRVGVVAVVGPACSEAAIGAAEILGNAGIPLISFAATNDELNNRLIYPTFFRTVYPDVEQTKAIISVIEFFEWKEVTVMYSDEAYGSGLVSNIMASANQAPVTITPIKVPVAVPEAGYESLGIFNRLQTNPSITPVIVAATPLVAENIFIAAYANGTLTAPWWYLATDGATAFDLIGEGDQLTLAEAMQGEIGMYPAGNFASDSAIQPFLSYWKSQTYSSFPGLLTLPASPKYTRPRAYVPHLLDAIQAMYNAFSDLVATQTPVTASAMLTKLADTNFQGSSGPISFNQGERVITGGLGSEFDFVQLKGATWQPAGKWAGTGPTPSFSLITELERPGVSGAQQTRGGTVPVAAAPTNLSSTTPAGTFNNLTEPAIPTEFQGTAFAPGSTPVELPVGATPSQIAELSGAKSGGGTSGGTIAAIVVPVTLVGLAAGAFVYYKYFRPSGDPQFVRML